MKAVLTVVGIIALISTIGWLCGGPMIGWLHGGPKVEIASVDYAPLKLRLKTSNINGLMGILFYSTTKKEYLWTFTIDYRPVDQVVYGVLPAGGVQVIPRVGHPRPLEVGEKILVHVSYQYDTLMAACSNQKTWALEIESEKKAKLLGESKAKLPQLTQVEIKDVEFPPLGLSLRNSNVKGLIRATTILRRRKSFCGVWTSILSRLTE